MSWRILLRAGRWDLFFLSGRAVLAVRRRIMHVLSGWVLLRQRASVVQRVSRGPILQRRRLLLFSLSGGAVFELRIFQLHQLPRGDVLVVQRRRLHQLPRGERQPRRRYLGCELRLLHVGPICNRLGRGLRELSRRLLLGRWVGILFGVPRGHLVDRWLRNLQQLPGGDCHCCRWGLCELRSRPILSFWSY